MKESQKPLLIGEAPPSGSATPPQLRSPLFPRPKNSAGWRLMRMTGLSECEYLKTFHRLNLLPHVAFAERWSAIAARESACNLLNGRVLEDRVVVLIGAKVFAAFQDVVMLDKIPLRIQLMGQTRARAMVYLPHPSGRNLWYNSAENKRAAGELLSSLARDG